jgi:hypothetical protein
VTVQLIIYMALRFMGSPLHWVWRFQAVARHLYFGCAQYAAGNEKVRFPFLSNETFELSGVHMIRPNRSGEALESPSPPALKGNLIKIRVNHTPTCFYQIVDSPLDGHC